MMQYKDCCNTVMDCLSIVQMSSNTKWLYRRTCNDFGEFLESSGTTITLSSIDAWLFNIEASKRSQCKHILLQVLDVFEFGCIQPIHTCRGFFLAYLNNRFKDILDEFLADVNDKYDEKYLKTIQRSIAEFLYFCQNNGCVDISNITYSVLFTFENNYICDSMNWKSQIQGHITRFFEYCAKIHALSFGFALFYNDATTLGWRLEIKQFSKKDRKFFESQKNNESDFSAHDVWALIPVFTEELSKYHYSTTVKNYAIRVLNALSLFLDIYNLPYTVEIANLWVNKIGDYIGEEIKKAQRVIRQFDDYCRYGGIVPEKIYSFHNSKLDLMPEWCAVPIMNYISLRVREGKKRSTIDMDRASAMRFCQYLCDIGLTDFSMLTAEHIISFNLQDYHSTTEGKNAYNVRIRQFIEYLTEEQIVNSPGLKDVLFPSNTRQRKIISTLTPEQEGKLRETADVNDPVELRDRAMVALGLNEGLRSIDAVEIKFENINWNEMVISFAQKKTDTYIELPLSTETGNALYRYIKYARPESDSDYVFLSIHAPYKNVTRAVCYKAMKRLLPELDEYSFHKLRKTHASRLLAGGATLSHVAESLGHAGNQTVHKYLNLDEQRIRMCALSLEETGLLPKEDLFKC